MRKMLLFCAVFFGCFSCFAKSVNEAEAMLIAKAFVANTATMHINKDALSFRLAYRSGAGIGHQKDSSGAAYFYVFNISVAKGFVIIAGDDVVLPVLGYSTEENFNPNNIPQNVAKWLEGYRTEIRSVVAAQIQATPAIEKEWLRLRNNQAKELSVNGVTAVNPLIQTKWDQAPYYNALCPGGSVTGCVATAMAQVMKYWNYPVNGTGFHSYNPDNNGYGTLSANFGSTTYQWNAMPLQVTSANSAVATLMYHAGVSVDMSYSPESSGAYILSAQSPVTNCAEYALKTYFGYKSTLKGVAKADYSLTQWIDLMKAELDASRPIIYGGIGNGGGHCFVADGYDNSSFFHFNWGWSGSYNGYFQINSLNPGGVGTGGGTGGYNSNQQAVIGIEPPAPVAQNYSLQLSVPLTINPSFTTPAAGTIYYGQAFTVSTNFVNAGNGNFAGDYCAAAFDAAGTFIDYIEIKTAASLQAGYTYTNNIVFSSAGIYSLLPATYSIAIFSRHAGGNWIEIANSGNIVNSAALSVINPDDIELNKEITMSPSGELVEGQPASVNVNIRNDGTSTFTGQYGAGLYNLDGTLAQAIDVIDETTGLDPNYTYIDPFLTFNTSAITVKPGTYLLVVSHKPTGGDFRITGSSYFQNPVKVIVKSAPFVADPYEVNNTVEQSASLPLVFSGNKAPVLTTGSNCHINADVDFYKVLLPPGSGYSIAVRLQDSYSSSNGITYSLDGLFSYSTDGLTWSDTFDDIMPDSIKIAGGNTLYIKVAPYFAGNIGTYLLDLQVSKSALTFVWTGTLSADWTNGRNWSFGKVPGDLDDAIIPAGTAFSPLIGSGVTAGCRKLQVNKGAAITVASGGDLNIKR